MKIFLRIMLCAVMLIYVFQPVLAAETDSAGFETETYFEETFSSDDYRMDAFAMETAEAVDGRLMLIPKNTGDRYIMMRGEDKVENVQFQKVEVTLYPVQECPLTITALTWQSPRHLLILQNDGRIYEIDNPSPLRYKSGSEEITYESGEEMHFEFYLFSDASVNDNDLYNVKYRVFLNGSEIELQGGEFSGDRGFNTSGCANRIRISINGECPDGEAIYVDDVRISSLLRNPFCSTEIEAEEFDNLDAVGTKTNVNIDGGASLFAEDGMLRLTAESTTLGGAIDLTKAISFPENGKRILKIKFGGTTFSTGNTVFKVKAANGQGVQIAKLTKDGNIYITNHWETDYRLCTGGWKSEMELSFIFDDEKLTMTNGNNTITEKYENIKDDSQNTVSKLDDWNLSYFYMWFPASAENVDFYIDEIKWMYVGENDFICDEVANKSDFGVLEAFSFRTANPILDKLDASQVSLVKTGEDDEVSFVCETNGVYLKIIPQSPLDFESEYTVMIKSGVEDCFGGVLEKDFSCTVNTGKKKIICQTEFTESTVDFTVYNPYAEQEGLSGIYVCYDEQGKIKGAPQILDLTADSGDVVRRSIDILLDDGDYAYSFIIEDVDTLGVLSAASSKEDIELLGTDVETVIEEQEIVKSTVSVSGNAGDVAGRLVLAHITDYNTINIFIPVMTTENGRFEIEYDIPGDETDYDLSITIGGDGVFAETELNYLGEITKSVILERINASVKKEDINDVLNEYLSKMNLASEMVTGNTCSVLLAQKPYSTYDDMFAMLNRAYSVFEKIQNTEWSSLAEVIITNEDIIAGKAVISDPNSSYSYFKKLSSTAKNEICNKIKNSKFTDFEGLMSLLNSETEKYKMQISNSSSNNIVSNGGGSSGGSRGTSFSGGVSISTGIQPDNSDVSHDDVVKFNDLDSVEWAKTSICKLNEMNVISDADSFRPHDFISREEFVKMLVMLFELDYEGAETDFCDVSSNAWYAPYIGSAQKYGLIVGQDDGSFGVGESITREDIAVMLCRAADNLNKPIVLKDEGSIFLDDSFISSYARDSVSRMKSANIIQGTGDGYFEPKKFAERAEAAKMMYGFYQNINVREE